MSSMADDSAQLQTNPSACDHARRSKKSEKPWKPCPPKRSVSLRSTDVAKAMTSEKVKRMSPKVKDRDVQSAAEPGPAVISVVPVDVSGRPYSRLRDLAKDKLPEEVTPNGSLDRPLPARYSTIIDASNYDLYGVHEHGFAVKPSLNLRGKNPSRDRWMTRTGMNLDQYSFEDELRRSSSRGFGPKIEKLSSKSKPNASFLLCSSRRSLRSSPREPVRPYQMTPSAGSLTSEMFQAAVVLPTKWQGLSENASREPVYSPRPTDCTREPDKKKKPRLTSTDLSQGRAPLMSSGTVENHDLDTASGDGGFVSDHEPFFLSVSVPTKHSFWSAAKTRKSLPVSIPQLSENDLMIATSTRDSKCQNGAAEAFTVMRLEDSRRVPDSVQVISEAECGTMFCSVPVPDLKIQFFSATKGEKSDSESKTENQSRCLPSHLDLKEQETSVPDTLSVRHPLAQTKESFLSISEDKREAFDRVNHRACEYKLGGFEKSEQTMQRLSAASEFSSDYSRLNLPFPNSDGASMRSSTTSDWYSARDCHSESICVDSLGSDPFSLDCASSKGSTTLLSRVKRAIVHGLGAVWTMFLPTSAKHPQSPAPDSLSDVDSGCSIGTIGTNNDLGMLQRSPSEISELQKLAVLADRIATDKSKNGEQNANGDSPSRRRPARAFYREVETVTCGGSLSGTGCSSEATGKQLHGLTGCLQSSCDSFGTKAEEGWKTSSEAPVLLTLPLSSIRSNADFERPYTSLQENCNYFSTTRPFVSSLKVHRCCGEMKTRTFSQALDGSMTYERNSIAENSVKERSRQFSAAEELLDGGKLSCSDSLLLCEAPGTHFEIPCNTEKQTAGAGSQSCTNKTSSDIKLLEKTLARTSLPDSRAEPRSSTGNFSGMQLCKETFDIELKLLEECLNSKLTMNLPSSKAVAESLLENCDKDFKSAAPISKSREQRFISESGTQKSTNPPSGELSGRFSDSESGTFSEEQFSVSPELDQAIQMLAASIYRLDSDSRPEYSASCMTTISKTTSFKEKTLNDVYVSPDDLRRMLEQSNSGLSQKVKTSPATQSKKIQDQCFENSSYHRGISTPHSVPKSCSLNDSEIHIVTDRRSENMQSSQDTQTAENYINLNKTGAQVRHSDEQHFRRNHCTEVSSTKQNPTGVFPTLSEDLENIYAKNCQMFEDFHAGGSKVNHKTVEMEQVWQMGSSHYIKSHNQSTLPLPTKDAPSTHKAGFVLTKPTGTSTASSQAVSGSVEHQIGRKFGAVAASPSVQRTQASKLAFLSSEFS